MNNIMHYLRRLLPMKPIGSRPVVPSTFQKTKFSFTAAAFPIPTPNPRGRKHTVISYAAMNTFVELRAVLFPFNDCADILGNSGTFWGYVAKRPDVAKRIADRRKAVVTEALKLL